MVPREIVGVDASAGTETRARRLTMKTGVTLPATRPSIRSRLKYRRGTERRILSRIFRLMVSVVPSTEYFDQFIAN